MTEAGTIPETLLPVRRGDTFPVVGDAPFLVGTASWQLLPPQDSLIVVVKTTADIVPDEAARLRAEPDVLTGELRYDDDAAASAIYPSDYALFKPRADVVMVGRAYAPGGSATAMSVALRFGHPEGRIEKRITVVGDRLWQRGLTSASPGEPEPFSEMPLVYERAFGGPKHGANPWGRGHGDGLEMPNLELSGKLVSSPSSKLAPACFAPLAFDHPARWKKLGHYDRSWLQHRWPYFAEDFDWSFFQDAPVDQQLAYLRGDEPFEADGVHPQLATVRGRLPGRVPRCFWLPRVTSDRAAALASIALNLDTAVLDFGAQVVHLLWRGAIPVSADDAPEIRGFFVTEQPADGPEIDLDEATRRCRRALTPLEPVAVTAAEPVPANDATEEADPEVDEAQVAARFEDAIRAQLASAGVVDRADADPAAAPPPPDPEAIAASLRDAGADEEEVAELMAALEDPTEEDEADEAAAERPALRERVVAMLAEQQSFADFDFEEADLSDLDFSRCDLLRARLQNARFRRCRFDGALLLEVQAGGADFAEASFVGAELSMADLSAAELGGSRLDEAHLTRTVLHEAQARAASFAGCRGDDPVFVAGDFEGCSFDGAVLQKPDFSRANLTGARFVGAEAPDIMLYDARAGGARFDGAKLLGARAEGAMLAKASLVEVIADGAVFENALLDEAVLRGADLKGASFLRATCRRADFSEADLSEGRLERAKLQGALFRRASLMMAALDFADLNIADLREANLHSAGLWGANLLDCKLGGAIVTKSTLVMRAP